MNGYTKMMEILNSTTESSDIPSLQQTQKANETKNGDSSLEMMEGKDAFTEKTFGAIKFQRNSSVSSSTSLKQVSAVKRAFSISLGRSSSVVSERYCRIHDQQVALASPFHDEPESVKQEKRKTGSGKGILKACKRIFRL